MEASFAPMTEESRRTYEQVARVLRRSAAAAEALACGLRSGGHGIVASEATVRGHLLAAHAEYLEVMERTGLCPGRASTP